MDRKEMLQKLKILLTSEQYAYLDEIGLNSPFIGLAENQYELDLLLKEGHCLHIYLNSGIYEISADTFLSQVEFIGIVNVTIKIIPSEELFEPMLSFGRIDIMNFKAKIIGCHIMSDYCVQVNEAGNAADKKFFYNCSYNENITTYDIWNDTESAFEEYDEFTKNEIDQIIADMSDDEIKVALAQIAEKERLDDLNKNSDLMKRIYANIHESTDDKSIVLNFEDIIHKYKESVSLLNAVYRVSFLGEISHKKLVSAQKKFAKIEKDESPLVFIDTTLFGTGKGGLLITDRAIYYSDMFSSLKGSINLKDIDTVTFTKPESTSLQTIKVNVTPIFIINKKYRDAGIALIHLIMDMRNSITAQEIITRMNFDVDL